MPDIQVLSPLAADFSPVRNWVTTVPITVSLSTDHLLLSNGSDSLLLSDGVSFLLLASGSGGSGPGSTFKIKLQGNFTIESENIRWRYALIDNLDSPTEFTLSFNSYFVTVPAFSRATYPIPSSCGEIALIGVQSSLQVILSSASVIAPDVDNQYAIALAQKANFPVTILGASGSQSLGETGEKIIFQSPGSTIVYSLVDPTLVENGFIQKLQNAAVVPATQDQFWVEIKPKVGQTINGVFTNANPLRLYPGDSGDIISDGVNWYFDGSISYQSPAFALPAAGNGVAIANPMGRMPDSLSLYMRCVTANAGFAAGDEIYLGAATLTNATSSAILSAFYINAGNVGNTINFRMSSGSPFAIPNKTTGVITNITPANWNFVVRMATRW